MIVDKFIKSFEFTHMKNDKIFVSHTFKNMCLGPLPKIKTKQCRSSSTRVANSITS